MSEGGREKKRVLGWGFAGGEEIWFENGSRCYRSVQHQGGVFTMLWVCHLSSRSCASASGPNPVRFQIELSKRCKDGPIWPLNRTRRRRLLPIWDLRRCRFPQMFPFYRTEPDPLSRDCTVGPASHQALFSSGNHPCPYVCSPGSCHDNSLRLISLLFTEWHLNDHFMDRRNAPMWIKKYKKVW